MVGPSSVPTGPALLCFDGSAGARHAVEAAAAIVGAGGAVVAYVWTPLMGGAFRYGPDIELRHTLRAAAAEMDEVGAQKAAAIAAEGAELARRSGFGPVEVVVEPASENAATKLLEIADRVDADVVVAGSSGHGALGGLVGSVCHGLINRSASPVLIVPQSEASGG